MLRSLTYAYYLSSAEPKMAISYLIPVTNGKLTQYLTVVKLHRVFPSDWW